MSELQRSPTIVDAHEDLAYNALSLGIDLATRAIERRQTENLSDQGGATTSIPDLIEGNVRVVFATLWVNPCKSAFNSKPCYSNAEEAHSQALAQLNYYRRLENEGKIKIITNRLDLEEVLASITRRIGIVLLMEGADPIRIPEETKDWFEKGVRIVGPAWGATRYCGGTKAPGPLTIEGRRLLKEMERCGLILDCSHFAEESFYEALDIFRGSIIVSHANCREYCPTDRQLSDDMIRAVTKKRAVIGTVLYNAFLDGTWSKGNPKQSITLSQVVKNIVHVSEIAGSKEYSGIGSDFDGGFGYESIPKELDTSADLYKIGDALRTEANFTESEASNVLGGNFLKILRKALPAN